jgi:hypothetical protein
MEVEKVIFRRPVSEGEALESFVLLTCVADNIRIIKEACMEPDGTLTAYGEKLMLEAIDMFSRSIHKMGFKSFSDIQSYINMFGEL